MKIRTVRTSQYYEIKISGSRFIGILSAFNDIKELTNIISLVKEAYPNATHYCYAYRVGWKNEITRANDDGEPNGSAGLPILNQLFSSQLKNCICIVVRYYGGNKLGVSGLIDAYKSAAKECIKLATIIEQEELELYRLNLSDEDYFKVIKFLKKNDIVLSNNVFREGHYHIEFQLPKSLEPFILDYLPRN